MLKNYCQTFYFHFPHHLCEKQATVESERDILHEIWFVYNFWRPSNTEMALTQESSQAVSQGVASQAVSQSVASQAVSQGVAS